MKCGRCRKDDLKSYASVVLRSAAQRTNLVGNGQWTWDRASGLSGVQVEHVGLVISGTATAAFEDGSVIELRRGALFYIPARPHDSWVIGDEPYVPLHFLGADHYSK